MRIGKYDNGSEQVECRIKRMGSKNTRIVVNGDERIVPSTCVAVESVDDLTNSPERLVPTIPLENFYRQLRNLTGSKQETFQKLIDALHDRHGPKDSVFLSELFRRSVKHAEFYSNISQEFYPERSERDTTDVTFADNFVLNMANNEPVEIENHQLKFVDYEIYPFRITESCSESGKSARSKGSGGMDLLLASDCGGILPAVGEIKAKTETVGPTFALVQSLMYAAQIVTPNQFLRLKTHYHEIFAGIDESKPRVDLIIFLQDDQNKNGADLEFALTLAAEVRQICSDYLRSILFLSCSIDDNGQQNHCEVIKPS